MGIISNASEAVKGLYSVFCSASQISCLWTHHLWAPRAFSSKVTWAGLSDRRHVSKDKPNLHSIGRNTEEHWILQCAWPVSLCVCLCTKKDTATALAFNTQLLVISHPAHTIQTYCIDFNGASRADVPGIMQDPWPQRACLNWAQSKEDCRSCPWDDTSSAAGSSTAHPPPPTHPPHHCLSVLLLRAQG